MKDSINKAWYRTFQTGLNIGARVLPWHKPITKTGQGAIKTIPGLLRESGVGKVMVVTGSHVVKSLGPKLFAVLDEAGIPYEVYSQVEANPSVETAMKIYEQYISAGCQGFIALGGGSPMDAAKAAAAKSVRPNKDFVDMAGLFKVMKKLPPFIAIPTTSGTGSETTVASVVVDGKTHHKYAIMDLCLIPKYAVLDADMVLGLPPRTTATTGMDALTHAVEAYISWTNKTKESVRCARAATKTIFEWLEKAYENGQNVEAREQMMQAAFDAGYAFTRTSVGNVHAIAHTLGGLYNTPHGLANAVILPIVLEDYGEAVYKPLAELAELTGVKTDGSQEEKAKAFIAEIRAMNTRMGIPTGFDFIKEEDIPQMITWALQEANPTYPVPVVYTRERCEKVIRRIINEA